MTRVSLPIPRSTTSAAVGILRGPVFEVLWRLFVILLFLALMLFLLSVGGFFGPFLAAALLSTLISDDVRRLVADVWYRRWTTLKL